VVQARRAKARPARVIIPLAVAAALLIGGSFAAVKFWPDATTAGPQAQSAGSPAESRGPSTAESSPSPSVDPASAAAEEALAACQAKVRAADEVIKQGKTGVEHWAEHIQAQKDNINGKATVDEMKARFKATRLAGPEDLKRYNEAKAAYEDLEGSCEEVEGADTEVATALADCSERSQAQEPLMAATAAGMKDWKNHLAFMQRNAVHQAGTPKEAAATWWQQYLAAPKNINAFKEATENFDAPSC
jgi:hypothetical protein